MLLTSEVGLGSAAMTVALIAWFKKVGLAPNQKAILVWSMIVPISAQVLLVLANVSPITVQVVSTAVIVGITSGLAASGLYSHASAASKKAKKTAESPPTPGVGPGPDSSWQRGHDLIVSMVVSGILTEVQGQAAMDALEVARHNVPGRTPPN